MICGPQISRIHIKVHRQRNIDHTETSSVNNFYNNKEVTIVVHLMVAVIPIIREALQVLLQVLLLVRLLEVTVMMSTLHVLSTSLATHISSVRYARFL